jgi:hypothetical protein
LYKVIFLGEHGLLFEGKTIPRFCCRLKNSKSDSFLKWVGSSLFLFTFLDPHVGTHEKKVVRGNILCMFPRKLRAKEQLAKDLREGRAERECACEKKREREIERKEIRFGRCQDPLLGKSAVLVRCCPLSVVVPCPLSPSRTRFMQKKT